jgi:hypothetical protein
MDEHDAESMERDADRQPTWGELHEDNQRLRARVARLIAVNTVLSEELCGHEEVHPDIDKAFEEASPEELRAMIRTAFASVEDGPEGTRKQELDELRWRLFRLETTVTTLQRQGLFQGESYQLLVSENGKMVKRAIKIPPQRTDSSAGRIPRSQLAEAARIEEESNSARFLDDLGDPLDHDVSEVGHLYMRAMEAVRIAMHAQGAIAIPRSMLDEIVVAAIEVAEQGRQVKCPRFGCLDSFTGEHAEQELIDHHATEHSARIRPAELASDQFYHDVCQELARVLSALGLPPVNEHGPGYQGVLNGLGAVGDAAAELWRFREDTRRIQQ